MPVTLISIALYPVQIISEQFHSISDANLRLENNRDMMLLGNAAQKCALMVLKIGLIFLCASVHWLDLTHAARTERLQMCCCSSFVVSLFVLCTACLSLSSSWPTPVTR